MNTLPDPMPLAPPRRRDWVVLGLFFLSLPVLLHGLLNVRSDTTDVTGWLPAGTEQRVQYERFVRNFGIDDYLIVSWDGCVPRDPRLQRFADAVRGRLGGEGRTPPLVTHVRTTTEVLDRLQTPPLNLPRREARRRLAGWMLGAETGTACAIIRASAAGKQRNAELVDSINEIARTEIGIEADQFYMGGSLFEAVTIDRESLASLKRFVLPSILAVLALALIAVRDVRLAAIMLAVSVYAQILSVAVIYYSDASLDAALMIMPTLVYVITMSGSMHLVNYFRHALELGERDPAHWTFHHGWRPCLAASVTTAIGLGSLMVSQVRPVRLFGMYSALNVLLALGVLLICVPSALRLFGRGHTLHTRSSQLINRRGAVRFTGWIISRHQPINWIAAGLVLAASMGLVRLQTSLNLQDMFADESRLVRNYAWLEREVGPLISIEVVLAFRHDADVRLLDQFETIRAVEGRMQRLPEIEATMSVMTFVPPLPEGGTVRSILSRALLLRKMEARRETFVEDGTLADDGESHLWRITAHLSALAGHEYGDVTRQLRSQIDELAAQFPGDVREGLEVHYTGLTPIVYRAQQQMLSDLMNSFLGAFALICPLMMWHLGGIRAGILAMIPNVAPVAVVFGMLGWLDVPIDIGIVLTASVGLGIAVDGTLHFVGWYRDCLRRGMESEAALANVFRTCATAMTQTTLICGLGLLVFGFSDFIPMARFAWILMWLLLVALLSDLVLIPALIAGPLGRVIDKWSGMAEPLLDEPEEVLPEART